MAAQFNPGDFNMNRIRLVVGLGNPGTRYAHTYHNAGRIALAMLEAHREVFPPRTRFMALDVFMNESGPAIARVLRGAPHTLLILHDDSDLALGTSRLVFGRGAAGHHGVESIIRALGTKDFWRLRIGIRPPSLIGVKASDFVLRPMPKTAEVAIGEVVEKFIRRAGRTAK